MAVVTGENKLRIEGENGRILKESYTKGHHIRHACGSDKNWRRDNSEISTITIRQMACSKYRVFLK